MSNIRGSRFNGTDDWYFEDKANRLTVTGESSSDSLSFLSIDREIYFSTEQNR